MRTTLVNGVLTVNEVETSPRHHVQRRATLVYPLAGDIVKQNLQRVLGQFASPYFVTRSPATLNVQRVRLASLAPSCLVWLAT